MWPYLTPLNQAFLHILASWFSFCWILTGGVTADFSYACGVWQNAERLSTWGCECELTNSNQLWLLVASQQEGLVVAMEGWWGWRSKLVKKWVICPQEMLHSELDFINPSLTFSLWPCTSLCPLNSHPLPNPCGWLPSWKANQSTQLEN